MRLYNTIMMAIVACAAVLLPYGTAAAAACGGNDMEPAAAESLRPGTTDPEDGAITLTDGTGREKNVSYLDAIRFEDFELIKDFSNTLPKDTQTVCLNMNIILDSTRIRTQHTVSLTPVLVSRDGKREIPFGTVIIDGRTRHKVFLRRDRLDGSQPQRDSAMAIIQRKNGKIQEYSYLFWEGTGDARYDMNSGFVVKGEDTAGFLQEKLSELGLTPSEYNEFIVYWLPKMQGNPWNLITFQTSVYTEQAKLHIEPEPDSVIRVFMAYRALEKPVEMPEPILSSMPRKGFTVVEWGGTEVK